MTVLFVNYFIIEQFIFIILGTRIILIDILASSCVSLLLLRRTNLSHQKLVNDI